MRLSCIAAHINGPSPLTDHGIRRQNGAMKCTHTIHDRSCHHGRNNANAPVLHIAPGQHSIVPPRRMGGNMDIRDPSTGTTLYLPVEVKGRL